MLTLWGAAVSAGEGGGDHGAKWSSASNPGSDPQGSYLGFVSTRGHGIRHPSCRVVDLVRRSAGQCGESANETASGWQEVLFARPVAVQPGVTYVASYYTSSGYYSANNDYFNTNVVSGPVTALGDGVDGGNGVYAYGSGRFPRNSYRKSNYWVDIVYRT